MKKEKIVILIPMLVLGSFLAPTLIHQAHAAITGEVCLADPTTPNSSGTPCPTSAPVFDGHQDRKLSIAVFIQGSDALNGFDIAIKADHRVLVPVGVNLTGTVLLGQPSVILECLQGVLKEGPICPSTDSADTLHYVVIGGLGQITAPPTTGLLFTAIYNITGITVAAGIPITYQTGCNGTSVSNGTCVTISSGSPTPIPETILTATFSTSATPDFGMSILPDLFSLSAGSTSSSTLTVSSINGFAGTVSLTYIVTPTLLTVSLSPAIITLSANQNRTSVATVSTSASTPLGSYLLTVNGTSGLLTHSSTITFSVTSASQPDFSISANPTVDFTFVGSEGVSWITVSPLNGFTDAVNLVVTSSAASLVCIVTPYSVQGHGIPALLCDPSNPGTFTATVTGTSGSLNHSVAVTFAVTLPAPSGGIVCIANDGANSCPISPMVIPGPHPGLAQQFRVSVVVNSSDPFNGFDVTLAANRTILKPTGIDLSGTVLPPRLNILVECIGGTLIQGARCAPTDNANTLHLAVVGGLTFSGPITGLLFTAIYNVTSNAMDTNIGFQTGCANTSVSGGVCVTIASGGTSPDMENVQTSSFTNLPFFSIDVLPSANLILPAGSADSTLFLTISSLIGFGGTTGATINLSGSSSPPGPLVTVSPNNVAVTAGTPGNQTLAGITVNVANTVAPGLYTLSITGTSNALSNTVTISLTVTGPDFSISTQVPSLAMKSGSANSTTIVATGQVGFDGTLFLSATDLPFGVTASIFPSNVTLSAASSKATSTITILSSGLAIPGGYVVTFVATNSTLFHFVKLKIDILSPGFSLFVDPSSELITAGDSRAFRITVVTDGTFNGTISLGASVSPPGPTVIFSPATLTLPRYGFGQATLEVVTTNSTQPGYYLVTVTARNGTLVATRQVQVTVQTSPPPDFLIIVYPSIVTLHEGSNANFTIILNSISSFSGNISLTAIVTPSTTNPVITTMVPPVVFLGSGGTSAAKLIMNISRSTPSQTYTLTVSGSAGLIMHDAVIVIQVQPPPDLPPVANFTFALSNPVVGQNVGFDGSTSSDTDGTVVSWAWSFDNGFFTTGEFVNTSYNTAGNFTVTLTVTDNAGLSSSTSSTVSVISQPAHDVAMVFVNPQPRIVVSTQTVYVQVQLANNGLDNENISVTVYANGQPVRTLTGLFVPACTPSPYNFCGYRDYFFVPWDTSRAAPGNYTISASVSLALGEVDPTPSDNSLADGTVTVLPAPIITLSPNTGPDGTKVLAQGTGYPAGEHVGYIEVNFDNMTLGFTLSHNGTFTFTFDVPLSQSGPHGVFAFDQNSGAHASATFTVQPPTNNNLALTIDTGTVYFPGDTTVAYILTTSNGGPVESQSIQLQVVLFRPDGTNITLTASRIGAGLYKTTYAIPSAGPLGTYLIFAKAHRPGPLDASSLVSFEVKLPWLSSNSGKITVGATTLAGLVGLVGVAWKKGYLRRKKDNESSTSLF